MKYLFTLMVLAVLSTSIAKAQWTPLTSNTTSHLSGIRFTDAQHGFCIGHDGVFLKTTDGGANWVKKIFPTGENFTELYFADHNPGFICSNNHVYKTTDGGINFTEITNLLQHPDTPSKVMDNIGLAFSDSVGILTAIWNADTCMAIKTMDGGNSWMSVSVPGDNLSSITYSVVSANVIYVLVLDKQYKSVDGGLHWSFVRDLPYSIEGENGFKVFDTSGRGYASCSYATKFVTFYNDVNDTSRFNGWTPPRSFSFLDSLKGYFLQDKKLYQTNDRGLTYSMQYNFSDNMQHVFFLNDETGFVCGDSGVIYKTTAGGTATINPPDLENEIKIYPNPTSHFIAIENKSSEAIQQIELTDATGRILKSFNKNQKRLDVNEYPKGAYLLHIHTKDNAVTRKIIIN